MASIPTLTTDKSFIRRWRSDGTLEHLGRIDDQVKVKASEVAVGELLQLELILITGISSGAGRSRIRYASEQNHHIY